MKLAIVLLLFLASGLSLVAQTLTDPQLAPGSQPLVNRRVLGIFPNTILVENSGTPVAALSTRQKFQLFTDETFVPGFVILSAATAGMAQAFDFTPRYGHGGAAYAKRFGAVSANIASNSLFTNAVFPSMIHQDPRYFRKGTGTKKARLWYAISRVAITRQDSGRAAFNISQLGGTAASIALGNLYYPSIDRNAATQGSRFGYAIGIQALFNVIREFGPAGHQ